MFLYAHQISPIIADIDSDYTCVFIDSLNQ